MSADWVNVVVTALLGLIGLYLVHSLRRQARVTRDTQAIEKRFAIYEKLWGKTGVLAPMDDVIRRAPLSECGRKKLYDELTAWFFTNAGGMVLGEPARTIYLRAKENLGYEKEDFGCLYPASARRVVQAATDPEQARLRVVRRQFSLLRTAMRADLGIFGEVYGTGLKENDKDFLRNCGARLWRRPWHDGGLRVRIAEWRRRDDDREDRPCKEPDAYRLEA